MIRHRTKNAVYFGYSVLVGILVRFCITAYAQKLLTPRYAGPFGGMRLSGMGRELGIEGLEGFRDTKHIHLDYKIRRMPDWFPYDWSSLKKS